jgi:outer membrane protein OmpA-like peptidoglycan-associated protein
LAGQKVTITGGGLKANSDYTLVMHSTPVVIYKSVADASGNFSQVLTIPAKACLATGKHNLVLTGTSPLNKAVTATGYFTLDDGCVVAGQAVKSAAKSWTLSGFLFGYTQPQLNAGGVASLKALASVIKGAKTITVYGYTETDTKSAAIKKANIVLAQGRCDNVVAFLKSLGIKATFKTVAKGGVDPVSLTDQSKNRRVVIDATY